MLVEIGSAILQQCVTKIVEPPLRRNTGIELPHRTGGEIARVSERCESVALAFFISLLESRRRDKQVAPPPRIPRNARLLQLFSWGPKRDPTHGTPRERD